MTYENHGILHCDTCPQHFELEELPRDRDDAFKETMMDSKRAGWRSYKGPDDEWAHACPACVEVWKTEQHK